MDSRIAPTGNTAHGRPGPGPVTPETGQPQAHYQGRSVEPVESDEEIPQLEAIPRRTVQKPPTLWQELLVNHIPDNLRALGLASALTVCQNRLDSSPLMTAMLSFSQHPFVDLLDQTVRLWLADWKLRHEYWSSREELTMASLWVTTLWNHYRTNPGKPTHAQIDAWAQDFEHTQLAQLRPHLDFIHKHSQALRQLFVTEPVTAQNIHRINDPMPENFLDQMITEDESALLKNGARCHYIELLRVYGLCSSKSALDNTHMAYVMAQRFSQWRTVIEKHTGEPPPETVLKF